MCVSVQACLILGKKKPYAQINLQSTLLVWYHRLTKFFFSLQSMILLCVFLLPWLISDKSKRRTKTVKKSLEPKWNQTFVYSHVHRRDFREHMLEITVWDQPKVQDEESSFLGEASKTHVSISILLLWLSISNSLPFFHPNADFDWAGDCSAGW